MKTISTSEEYVIASRRIAGTHAEKVAQIDGAIQELLDIKLLECAGDRPNVRFLAVPRRSHWLGMTMTILVMLVLLVLLFGVHPAHAQTAAGSSARAAGSALDTFRAEYNHRAANVPYFSGGGGVTPPGGNTGAPGSLVEGWSPDLRKTENRVTFALLVKM